MHACETWRSLPELSFLRKGRLCSPGLKWGPYACLVFWAGNTSRLAGMGHPEWVAQRLHLLSWKLCTGGIVALECNPGIFLAPPVPYCKCALA